ncbi:protein of DUF2838 family [Pseudohyphozyma bogoriensis]|nr:protein of DUF2838 family [Pseudohyphozyma bogoriensis]
MDEPSSTLRHRSTSTSSDPAVNPLMSSTPSATATPASASGGGDSPPSPAATPFNVRQDDLFSGMGLLDLLVMVDAHLELWTRGIRKGAVSWREKSARLVEESKQRAGRIKLPRVNSSPFLSQNSHELFSSKDVERLEKRYKEARVKAKDSFKVLVQKWEEEKTVRMRDKISFFLGVMNVLTTALLLGFRPEWVPSWYSAQCAVYAPLRIWSYKKLMYHYFLFDLCYAVNLLCLVYIWIFPGNPYLFEACYGLALGSLGTAIATWRNSLVFHSLDKVISLAIHIFPPLVFTTIRHFYPNAEARYPALTKLPHLRPLRSLAINMFAYSVWQFLYYRYVIVARKEKIKQGRTTSFTYLMNDRKRLIGKIAAKVPEAYREPAFIGGQALYTLVTLLIPIFVLYDSRFWSGVYIIALFAVSTWNGSSFYLDVFARKFEKELIALRKEFEEQQAIISRFTPSVAASNSPTAEDPDHFDLNRRPSLDGVLESEDEEGELVEKEDADSWSEPSEKARGLAAEITGKEGLGEVQNPTE